MKYYPKLNWEEKHRGHNTEIIVKDGKTYSVCHDCKKGAVHCEVYSRVVGYLRPVQQWNLGKQAEFSDRLEYKIE